MICPHQLWDGKGKPKYCASGCKAEKISGKSGNDKQTNCIWQQILQSQCQIFTGLGRIINRQNERTAPDDSGAVLKIVSFYSIIV
jgi:hypothetical protein